MPTSYVQSIFLPDVIDASILHMIVECVYIMQLLTPTFPISFMKFTTVDNIKIKRSSYYMTNGSKWEAVIRILSKLSPQLLLSLIIWWVRFSINAWVVWCLVFFFRFNIQLNETVEILMLLKGIEYMAWPVQWNWGVVISDSVLTVLTPPHPLTISCCLMCNIWHKCLNYVLVIFLMFILFQMKNSKMDNSIITVSYGILSMLNWNIDNLCTFFVKLLNQLIIFLYGIS